MIGENKMEDYYLESCPICKSKAKWRFSPAGTIGRSRTKYGILCSNGDCSWSYAYVAYSSRGEATKAWNAKCRKKKMLDADSTKLKPCICGGKARLIFERYGDAAMVEQESKEGWWRQQ